MPSPITWKNINAPDATGAARILELAGDRFNSAFDNLGNIADNIQGRVKESRDLERQGAVDNILNKARGYSDPNELRAAQEAGVFRDLVAQADPEFLGKDFLKQVSPDAITALGTQKQQQIQADRQFADSELRFNSRDSVAGLNQAFLDNNREDQAKYLNQLRQTGHPDYAKFAAAAEKDVQQQADQLYQNETRDHARKQRQRTESKLAFNDQASSWLANQPTKFADPAAQNAWVKEATKHLRTLDKSDAITETDIQSVINRRIEALANPAGKGQIDQFYNQQEQALGQQLDIPNNIYAQSGGSSLNSPEAIRKFVSGNAEHLRGLGNSEEVMELLLTGIKIDGQDVRVPVGIVEAVANNTPLPSFWRNDQTLKEQLENNEPLRKYLLEQKDNFDLYSQKKTDINRQRLADTSIYHTREEEISQAPKYLDRDTQPDLLNQVLTSRKESDAANQGSKFDTDVERELSKREAELNPPQTQSEKVAAAAQSNDSQAWLDKRFQELESNENLNPRAKQFRADQFIKELTQQGVDRTDLVIPDKYKPTKVSDLLGNYGEFLIDKQIDYLTAPARNAGRVVGGVAATASGIKNAVNSVVDSVVKSYDEWAAEQRELGRAAAVSDREYQKYKKRVEAEVEKRLKAAT